MKTATVGLVACLYAVGASSQPSPINGELRQVLDSAVSQSDRYSLPRLAGQTEAPSRWLTSSPELQIGHLQSSDHLGADEWEIGITLPLQPPGYERLATGLTGQASRLNHAELDVQRLELSGLIRESLWNHRIAATRERHALRQQQMLNRIAQRQQKLTDAGLSNQVVLLQLQQELLAAQQNIDRSVSDLAFWNTRFQQLTGGLAIPSDIHEGLPTEQELNLAGHPLLSQYSEQYQYDSQFLQASSTNLKPWEVALIGKRVDTAGISDHQIGVQVSIPLGRSSQLTRTETTDAKRLTHTFEADYTRQRLAITQHITQLQQQLKSQEVRQHSLDKRASIAEKIIATTKLTMSANAAEQELLLRRLMEAHAIQNAAELNQVQLSQTISQLRQAAGLSL